MEKTDQYVVEARAGTRIIERLTCDVSVVEIVRRRFRAEYGQIWQNLIIRSLPLKHANLADVTPISRRRAKQRVYREAPSPANRGWGHEAPAKSRPKKPEIPVHFEVVR